ncbi:fibronectin type-III domain-containing protein 3a isoform X1 [Selaginella moellendorffii]|uniref:fibronectin type-III domain-containing protein 3a isoform X1 n=1 Tax=Selaginella moellendorffii TaxID=88036 RepID=UPI000D1C6E7F|nr:fibronectin type-III domain-containing protein 3a isoform X1 [Selaginella moellendorffii]|eukprot:XP_024515058.1 fibronectin type-III domain-containing protein 3a isoform X1 [Selaginella moellendorffii]
MGEAEETLPEPRRWAPPPIPICAAADRSSLLLEWPKYVDFADGFEYCLELGLKRALRSDLHGRRPGKKNAGMGRDLGAPELIEFAVAWSEHFPQGIFTSSAAGYAVNFDCLEWKTIYRGSENSSKVEDLIPGMGYVFRLCVMLPDSCSNEAPPPLSSDQIMFFTIPCAPCPPECPLLVDRGRTSLKLKWSPPSITGGMAIREYIAEMKRPGGDFENVYSGGTNLTVKVTRLVPGTSYIFRVQALSCLGWSGLSKEVTYVTASSVPAAPTPPSLLSSSRNSISLCWEEPDNHGSPVSSYTLEADDGLDGPFSVVYSGEERSCEVGNLRSGTSYKFRVLAHNGIGKGAFSASARFSTSHSPPSAPRSLSILGKTSTSGVIGWSPPDYNGGSSITGYELEFKLKASGSCWTQAYSGQSSTCNLIGLRPGCQYHVQVRAKNNEGCGDFSQEASFMTSPGLSEAPSSPVFSEIRSTSLKVSWDRPNHDGGSAILGYRLEMLIAETSDSLCVYRGDELSVGVDKLIPGQKYIFKVQALNKAGSSGWSGPSEVWTKAAVPDAPETPTIVNVSSTTVSLRWISPKPNGSCILSYRLQMANLGYDATNRQNEMFRFYSSGTDRYIAGEENTQETQTEDNDQERHAVQSVYDGPALAYTLKNLQPWTSYAFCLQALNSVGESVCSKIILSKTSPSCPSPPSLVISETSTDTVSLQWELPQRDNGASVISFGLHMKKKPEAFKNNPRHNKTHIEDTTDEWTEVYKGALLNYALPSLLPGHSYMFRLVAYNVYGPSGPSFVTASTLAACPLPPSPPTFSGISPTSVRVRWAAPTCDNGAPILRYRLLMDHSKSGHMHKVYEGDSTSYKVVKLVPGRSYQVAVQAINSAGASHLSDLSSVTLPAQIVLPALDAPQLARSNDFLSVSWTHLDQREVVSYTLQMESAPGKLLQVYEGSTPRFMLDINNSNKSCKFRVRANGGGLEVCSGPWSPFSTWTPPPVSKQKPKDVKRSSSITTMDFIRGMHQRLADPWSVKQRRMIALIGTLLTLTLALFTNTRD